MNLQVFAAFMRDNWGWVVSFLGVLGGIIGFFAAKIKALSEQNKALRNGVQALLRAQMIADYNHYAEKGFAPIYAKENFENCWQQYHALGANGVMNDIHERFMRLPTMEE